jgi:hypothetical protein
MDSLSVSLVQDIIRREGRSLLQYVSEAFPWATTEERAALAELTKIIEEERKGAANLAKLLTRHHASLPYVGTYPMVFTNINFASLDYLVPLLIEHQKRAISHLERDLALLHDKEARAEIQKILAIKERHLSQLEKLIPAKPAPAPVPAPAATTSPLPGEKAAH